MGFRQIRSGASVQVRRAGQMNSYISNPIKWSQPSDVIGVEVAGDEGRGRGRGREKAFYAGQVGYLYIPAGVHGQLIVRILQRC